MNLEQISDLSGVSVVFVGAVVAAIEEIHKEEWHDCVALSEGQTCCIDKIEEE